MGMIINLVWSAFEGTQGCLATQRTHSSCLVSDWVSKHVGVICFEWYVSAWLWVLFFFFGALLGFGYEYLESYTDSYPRSFGVLSLQTPWSLWEAAAKTLSWISATSKLANLYLFIAASEHIPPPSPRTKSPLQITAPSKTPPPCFCVCVCVFD